MDNVTTNIIRPCHFPPLTSYLLTTLLRNIHTHRFRIPQSTTFSCIPFSLLSFLFLGSEPKTAYRQPHYQNSKNLLQIPLSPYSVPPKLPQYLNRIRKHTSKTPLGLPRPQWHQTTPTAPSPIASTISNAPRTSETLASFSSAYQRVLRLSDRRLTSPSVRKTLYFLHPSAIKKHPQPSTPTPITHPIL